MKSVFQSSAIVFGVLLAALASGCASEGGKASAAEPQRYEPTDAVIGTRIPKKAAPTPSSAEREKSVEKTKDAPDAGQPAQSKS